MFNLLPGYYEEVLSYYLYFVFWGNFALIVEFQFLDVPDHVDPTWEVKLELRMREF